MKKWREKNSEHCEEYSKKYHENNKDRIKKYRKIYYMNNCEEELKQTKQYQKINSEKIKEQRKKHYQLNSERLKESSRQYRKNNPEKVRGYLKKYCAKKYKIDIKFHLNTNMANAIKKALKGNKSGRAWEFLVSYTLEDLINRLQKTLPQNYNWSDFLQGKLHIDHIIPKSAFNYTKPEHPDFKRCWASKNLRLLPAKENLIKSNKLYKPFQPALQLG